MIQSYTDCPVAKERIGFMAQPQSRDVLVAADVEGTDDHRALARGLEHATVGVRLLVIGGQCLAPGDQELRPKQPDTLRTSCKSGRDVVKTTYIGPQMKMQSVRSSGGRVGHRCQLGALLVAVMAGPTTMGREP